MTYTLIREETRTAAKPHRCIWCWQGIAKGERHVYEVSTNDGDLQSHRWHPECRAAMLEEAAAEGGYIEWTPGQERPPTSATVGNTATVAWKDPTARSGMRTRQP